MNVAESRGYDLVEVDEGICKLMDVGLMKYNESKKPKPKKEKIKQAQFNVGIGENDFDLKVKNIDAWLSSGLRVNIKVQLRGRLVQRPELAQELSIKILDAITQGQLTSPPKLSGGRDYIFTLGPS